MPKRLLSSCFVVLLLLGSSPIVYAAPLSSLQKRVEMRRKARMQTPRNLSLGSRVDERRRRRQEAGNMRVPSLKDRIIDGANMRRALIGVAPLRYNRILELSAQQHAQDMQRRDYFSHDTLEGVTSGQRMQGAGYGNLNAQECRCSYKVSVAENIAKGQRTPEETIQAWMDSQPHREAMLSKDYDEVGVGIAGDLWVLNMGSVIVEPVGR